jgi:glutathionyl-hydroquinone reductase
MLLGLAIVVKDSIVWTVEDDLDEEPVDLNLLNSFACPFAERTLTTRRTSPPHFP